MTDLPTPPRFVPSDLRELPRYSRDQLPMGEWQSFRKKVDTQMMRIDGPFVVDTGEGPLVCRDGWLARDSAGYPFAIAAVEQAASYEPVPTPKD